MESKFIRVRCTSCKNEQVIFGKAASKLNCQVCKEPLAESTGGKTKIIAQVLEVLE
ncbi:MAG: 30S ribosomal protein S27e [Candidatus Woesearchaeota archaeon]|nr:30S ribosomal protein S27e [Candidatus Woesearchaeota archaeon]